MARYRQFGAATIGGESDSHKLAEIAYWESYGEHRVSDANARRSVAAFSDAFTELEARLAGQPFLLGDTPSIVDIAWFVYANRLQLAGYPLVTRHPALGRWYDRLMARPGWADEVALPDMLRPMVAAHQALLERDGRRLIDVCGFATEGQDA